MCCHPKKAINLPKRPVRPQIDTAPSHPVIDGSLRRNGEPAVYDLEPHSPSDPSSDISLITPPVIYLPIPPDMPPTFSWIVVLDGALTDPIPEDGESSQETAAWHGYCRAKLVLRDRIHANFGAYATSATPEMKRMAHDLFDRYGRLRTEFKDHTFMSGSGVWGDELSVGDILLIENVLADVNVRYRGKGRAIFNNVVKKACCFSTRFVVLTSIRNREPTTLEEGIKMERYIQDGISFIRSLGFRRVGNTCWFAYVMDPNHESKELLAENDYDPSPVTYPNNNGQYEFSFHLIPWDDETACLAFFNQCLAEIDIKDIAWTGTNNRGCTVMHQAATMIKPTVLKWLMDHVPYLAACRNSTGATPFEALTAQLERQRTFFPDPELAGATPDLFQGFTDEQVECLRVLDTSGRTEAQLRFGCTCGYCLSGYLSPRMMRLLQLHASQLQGRLTLEADLVEHQYPPPIQSFFHMANNHMSFVLLHHTRVMFLESLSLRHGFANLFGFLAQALYDGVIPTDLNLTAVLLGHGADGEIAKEFFEHGGTYQIIRSIVFDIAAASNEWTGNGQSQARFFPEMEDLPECRNDLEFILAERMCNIDSSIFVGQVSKIPATTTTTT